MAQKLRTLAPLHATRHRHVCEPTTHPSLAEEFVAHSSAVNCLQIGRKSGTVFVSGGDDKKVNVWAVGKPNAIMVSRLPDVSSLHRPLPAVCLRLARTV